VSGAALNFAPVQIAPLNDGAASVTPLLAELESQVSEDQLEGLATRIRAVQAKFPGDALVETTLAQAELRAGHAEAAEAASDRALKADPSNTEAMVLKGRAIALRASKAQGPAAHALYEQARATFIAANKIDAEDPEPLYRFYRAFAEEGIAPSPNALSALHYAAVLAPEDLNLRVDSALAYLDEGKGKEARRELIPVAHYPHGGGMSEVAQKMIERIDAGDTKGAIAAAETKPAN
jgi:tetratricopeptide (TPR) repeat protein